MGVMPYERSDRGFISIESIPDKRAFEGELGMQVAEDGRIWLCIDGVAFVRFLPKGRYNLKEKDNEHQDLRHPANQDGQDNPEEGE